MKLFFCILVLAHAGAVYGKILPDAVTELLCHRSDPDFNECVLKNADKILPLLANGIPTYDIDPIDPQNVEFMTTEGDLENVKIKMIMKNITLYGLSSTKFNKIKIDPEALTGEFLLVMPHLRMTCEYYATGRLFVLPLESSAYFDGDFDNTNVTFNIRLKEVIRKGVTYFAVDKITETLYIEKSNINLTSIVPAEQPAVNVIQNFYNQNNRLVLDTVNPLVALHGPIYYQHVIDRFLRKVPAEELLPK
ncbi:uncharacterized protein CBL_06218 [Carabus blaptoides fortunei]